MEGHSRSRSIRTAENQAGHQRSSTPDLSRSMLTPKLEWTVWLERHSCARCGTGSRTQLPAPGHLAGSIGWLGPRQRHGSSGRSSAQACGKFFTASTQEDDARPDHVCKCYPGEASCRYGTACPRLKALPSPWKVRLVDHDAETVGELGGTEELAADQICVFHPLQLLRC